MVKRSVDQKLRLRNFDAGHGRIESGAVVKSRNGMIGIEGGKGICYQSRRPRQFPPRNPRSCAKNQNTLPPHLLSQPYHEVGTLSACWKFELSQLFEGLNIAILGARSSRLASSRHFRPLTLSVL